MIDVFNNNNAIVDHQPKRNGQCPQGHDVQCLSQQLHQAKCDQNAERQNHQNNCGGPDVAKKEHQNNKRQEAAEYNCFEHTCLRFLDDFGLVIRVRNHDILWQSQSQFIESDVNLIGNVDRIPRRLLDNVHQHCIVSIATGLDGARFDVPFNCGNFVESHGYAVLNEYRDCTNVFD